MCRAYFFGNMYLSPIQQGIQAGHTISEMSVKYSDNDDSIYWQWAEYHKTMILLNGGMSCNLRKIQELFEHQDNPFHWDYFEESVDALEGAITCVGVILPEQVYTNASLIRQGELDIEIFSEWEQAFFQILNGCRLA